MYEVQFVVITMKEEEENIIIFIYVLTLKAYDVADR